MIGAGKQTCYKWERDQETEEGRGMKKIKTRTCTNSPRECIHYGSRRGTNNFFEQRNAVGQGGSWGTQRAGTHEADITRMHLLFSPGSVASDVPTQFSAQ